MNVWFKILLGVVLLWIAVSLLSAAVGYLLWAAVAIGILSLVVAGVSHWLRQRKTINRSSERDAERAAQRMLKTLEQKSNKQ